MIQIRHYFCYIFSFNVLATLIFKNNEHVTVTANIDSVRKLIQVILFLMPSIVFATVLSKSNVNVQEFSGSFRMTVGSDGNFGVVNFEALNLDNKHLVLEANANLSSPQVLLMTTPQLHMSRGSIASDNNGDYPFVGIVASPDMSFQHTPYIYNLGSGSANSSVILYNGIPNAALQQATQIDDTAPIFQSDLADQDGISTLDSSQNYSFRKLSGASHANNFVSANDPMPLLGLESLSNDTAEIADTPSNPNEGEAAPSIDMSDVEPNLILEEDTEAQEEEVQNLEEAEDRKEESAEEVQNLEAVEDRKEESAEEVQNLEEAEDSALEAIESIKRVVDKVAEKKDAIPLGIDVESNTNTVYLDELEGGGEAELGEELAKLKEESQSVKALQRGKSGARRSLVLVQER